MNNQRIGRIRLEMKVSVKIKGYFRKKVLRNLRHIMLGYLRLRRDNKLHLIDEVKDAFTNAPLHHIRKKSSALFFGHCLPDSEVIVKQFLLANNGGLGFNRSLLFSFGSSGGMLKHPFPAAWLKIIEDHGIKVHRFYSAVLWRIYLLKMFFNGLLTIASHMFRSASYVFGLKRKLNPHGSFVYFESLTSGNLPQPCKDGRSHDIVTWYEQWPGRAQGIDYIFHNAKNTSVTEVKGIKVASVKSGVLPLTTFPGLLKFSGWSVLAISLAFFDIFRNRWWHTMLLRESAMAAIIRFQDQSLLAKDYLFHNSSWIYRPMWTYEAKRRGSRITFYFYSTNCETFKTMKGYPLQANSWQVTNWPCYLVWDKHQAEFVKRAVKNANIVEVGPIWFQSSRIELPELPPQYVAVFDVQPFRDSRYQILGMSNEYYTPVNATRFLTDIYSALNEADLFMALKRKRNMGSMIDKRYERRVKTLSSSQRFISLEYDISALRVIESCYAVISMPFTSTALLGQYMGKPSVYYDPSGYIQKDDRASHGIPVVTGKEELKAWLQNLQ